MQENTNRIYAHHPKYNNPGTLRTSPSTLDDIEETMSHKESKKSPSDASFTQKLSDLKDKLLKLPSAESNNSDFHSLVLQIDTGRHVEDDLVKQSGFRFFAKDDNTHIDDGSMVYLQRREHYEETEREEKHHRSKSVILSGSVLNLNAGARKVELDEKIDESRFKDDGKNLQDDLELLQKNRDAKSSDTPMTIETTMTSPDTMPPGPPTLSNVPRPPPETLDSSDTPISSGISERDI